MGTWNNSDGLYIKLGRDEGVSAHPAGQYCMPEMGATHVVEVVIDDLADLTETETILNDSVFIPANAHIMWVQTIALVAAATGTAIDVGLINRDRSTEIDYNGFLAAFETGDMDAVGETRTFYKSNTVPASITGTGALVGAEMTTAGGGYISASRTNSTAFTAGKVRIRVGYMSKGIDVL